MKTSRTLPDDVAIVRIQTPSGQFTVWSDRLDQDEARIARAIACQMTRSGSGAVVLWLSELTAILAEVA